MFKPKVLVPRRWPASVEAQLAEKFDVVLNRDDVPLTTHEYVDPYTKVGGSVAVLYISSLLCGGAEPEMEN